MNSHQIVKLIEQQSGAINGTIIKDLISEHTSVKEKCIRLFNSYKGDVPINNRVFTDTNKINNKLANDFRGDIVDEITGYLFGYPIKYRIKEDSYEELKLKKLNEELTSFQLRNNLDDLDNLTGKYSSICGYGARLLYVNPEGKEKVMNLNPWEVIFVMDQTLDEVQFAMIYYDIDLIEENGRSVKRTKVEWYDKKNVTFYISDNHGNFNLDSNTAKNPMPHMFDSIPVIRFVNDDTMQGDFEKVESLIDSYDRMMSDIQNEVEEFRLAYFGFFGCTVDKETITAARNSGAFNFPDKDSRGEFITKDLNGAVQFMENHKKTLNDNIYKFSKTVDMRDEEFSGAAMSGESRKWKLVGLENRAITKERKFTKACRDMFKVLASAWKIKNLELNPEDIQFQFTRNLPVDLKYAAEVSQALKGNVSEETRLSLLPFVKDAKAEYEKMQEEMESTRINLDDDQEE